MRLTCHHCKRFLLSMWGQARGSRSCGRFVSGRLQLCLGPGIPSPEPRGTRVALSTDPSCRALPRDTIGSASAPREGLGGGLFIRSRSFVSPGDEEPARPPVDPSHAWCTPGPVTPSASRRIPRDPSRSRSLPLARLRRNQRTTAAEPRRSPESRVQSRERPLDSWLSTLDSMTCRIRRAARRIRQVVDQEDE